MGAKKPQFIGEKNVNLKMQPHMLTLNEGVGNLNCDKKLH
jgi:hypothetical protein